MKNLYIIFFCFMLISCNRTENKLENEIKIQNILEEIASYLNHNHEDNFDIQSYREYMLKHKIGNLGYIGLIDYSGTILIHPSLSSGINIIDFTDDNGFYFIKELIAMKSGKIEYVHTGHTKYMYFKEIESLDAAVVVFIYGYELYEKEFHISR